MLAEERDTDLPARRAGLQCSLLTVPLAPSCMQAPMGTWMHACQHFMGACMLIRMLQRAVHLLAVELRGLLAALLLLKRVKKSTAAAGGLSLLVRAGAAAKRAAGPVTVVPVHGGAAAGAATPSTGYYLNASVLHHHELMVPGGRKVRCTFELIMREGMMQALLVKRRTYGCVCMRAIVYWRPCSLVALLKISRQVQKQRREVVQPVVFPV